MPHPTPIISKGLKQKLATISASNTSLASSPTSMDSPRKKGFFANWGNRRDSIGTVTQENKEKTMKEVMNKVIFQAGLDFETRPMVVITAAALPDPSTVSYDELLIYILSYLDLYVESDYTVVFLAAGGRHNPGWNWVWKTYRSLSRKYRKNLKQLYLVHSTWFTKMLFSLAGAIISPKFFRKIVYVKTLSELARSVPLTQIDIHSAVYQENLKYEKEINLPTAERQKVFGVPLDVLIGDQYPVRLPTVIKDCVSFLRSAGLEEEGLFRRSPNSVKLKQAQEAYDRGHPVSLESFGDPNIAAVLLKKFFRDLPEPIFPERLYTHIQQCPFPGDEPSEVMAIQYIRNMIYEEMPLRERELLSCVLHLLHDVSLRSSTNLMNAYNLALVFSPNLLVSNKNPLREVELCKIPGGPKLTRDSIPPALPAPGVEGQTTLGTIIQLCIKRYFEVFDEDSSLTDAVAPGWSTEEMDGMSGSSNGGPNIVRSDVEDLDDGMLVMPIEPTRTSSPLIPSSPPSAWNQSIAPYRPPKRTQTVPSTPSSQSQASSVRDSSNHSKSNQKPRSIISIENALNSTNGRGSITVGRSGAGGTTRKAHGAAVNAVSVTASGFFTPPTFYSDMEEETKRA